MVRTPASLPIPTRAQRSLNGCRSWIRTSIVLLNRELHYLLCRIRQRMGSTRLFGRTSRNAENVVDPERLELSEMPGCRPGALAAWRRAQGWYPRRDLNSRLLRSKRRTLSAELRGQNRLRTRLSRMRDVRAEERISDAPHPDSRSRAP